MPVMKISRAGQEVCELSGYDITNVEANAYRISGSVPAVFDRILADTSQHLVLKEMSADGGVLRAFDQGVLTDTHSNITLGTASIVIQATEQQPESGTC